MAVCSVCNGKGGKATTYEDKNKYLRQGWISCKACGGTGQKKP